MWFAISANDSPEFNNLVAAVPRVSCKRGSYPRLSGDSLALSRHCRNPSDARCGVNAPPLALTKIRNRSGCANRHNNGSWTLILRYLRRLRKRVDPRTHNGRASSRPRSRTKRWPEIRAIKSPSTHGPSRHGKPRHVSFRTVQRIGRETRHALPICRPKREPERLRKMGLKRLGFILHSARLSIRIRN